jgi:hypothetical protein
MDSANTQVLRIPLSAYLKTYWQLALFSIAFLAAFLLPQNPDLYRHQIMAFMLLACFSLALFLAGAVRKTSEYILLAVTIFYFGHSFIRILAARGSADWAMALSGQSLFLFFGPMLFFSLQGVHTRILTPTLMSLVCLGSSLVLIAMKLSGRVPYSFMNNPSADASILAVLYPVLGFGPNYINLNHQKYPHWIGLASGAVTGFVPVIAICMCGSTTGTIALAIALAISCLRYLNFKDEKLAAMYTWFFGAALFAIVVISHHYLNKPFFQDSGRYAIWRSMMALWWQDQAHLFGVGGGTFFLVGPAIQTQMHQPENSLFAFMHNDYLQIIWEQGFIGITLFLASGILILRKAFDRNWLFSALCTYGFIMLTQYPLRFAASAFIGTWLASEALFGTKR